LNFISSDYGVLEPFQDDSSAVRTLRALYIIIITVLFLNILIAMLNLKIKKADKNAANLYHLQMASLQVEIELGLLSSAERERRDWFPTWFTYSMTETEQRTWEDYVRKNKLKWDEDNDFAESKDNAPPPPPLPKEQNDGWANLGGTATEPLLDTDGVAEDGDLYGPGFTSASQQRTSVNVADDDSWTTEDEAKEVTPLPQSSSVAGSSPSATNEGTPNTQPSASKQSKAPRTEGATSSGTDERTQANDTAGEELACEVCGNPAKSCLGCGLVAYCSREHQKQDWKTHKVACKGKGKE
jgi:MYND finger